MEMEYDVISSCDIKAFVKDVNERLKKGWKLQGGLSIHGGHICQAMTMKYGYFIPPVF